MEDFYNSFRKAREDGKKAGDAARMMADDGVQPEEGHAYTTSPDFVCGDRSYTGMVLRVLKLNDSHALVAPIGDTFYGDNQTRLLTIADRAWYLADDMADLIEKATTLP